MMDQSWRSLSHPLLLMPRPALPNRLARPTRPPRYRAMMDRDDTLPESYPIPGLGEQLEVPTSPPSRPRIMTSPTLATPLVSGKTSPLLSSPCPDMGLSSSINERTSQSPLPADDPCVPPHSPTCEMARDIGCSRAPDLQSATRKRKRELKLVIPQAAKIRPSPFDISATHDEGAFDEHDVVAIRVGLRSTSPFLLPLPVLLMPSPCPVFIICFRQLRR